MDVWGVFGMRASLPLFVLAWRGIEGARADSVALLIRG
jgi:hypothetical protein